MSQTLYYTIQFSTLHQANPGYDIFTNAGNPYLEIGGVQSSVRKYGLEPGYGDPGQPPNFDTWDFSEWRIDFATFTRPADYGTAQGTYQREAPNGGTTNAPYQIWHSMSVPDTFFIPSEFSGSGFSSIINAAIDDARNLIALAGQAQGVPLVDIYSSISNASGLYNALASHINKQLELSGKASSGQITVEQLDQLSTQASQNFVLDLANLAGVHSVIVEAARQIVFSETVKTNPANNHIEASVGSTPGAGFVDGTETKYYEVGSPTGNTLFDHNKNGSYVVAGGGDDVVYGTDGSGVLLGGEGNDTLDYFSLQMGIDASLSRGDVRGQGMAFVDRIAGFENLFGTSYNDTLEGSATINVLKGGNGVDQLWGLGGDDFLEGDDGADFLNGGDGFDVAMYPHYIFDAVNFQIKGIVASLIYPWLNTGEAAGDSYSSIEGLSGTDYNDRLMGDMGANMLDGGAGDDWLSGLQGNDLLIGGAGADTMYGDDGADVLHGGIGDDYLEGGAGANGAGDTLYGEDGNDTLSGTTNAAAYLDGGAGNDSLYSKFAGSILHGGDGADFLSGSTGGNTLFGDAGDDVIVANSDADYLDGGTGHDTLYGGGGGDTIIGGDGFDALYGQDGADYLFGGAGNDYVGGGDGGDFMQGDAGDDSMDGGLVADYMDGGDGNDSMYGGDGNDVMHGGTGNDYLGGQNGSDTMFGEAGNDVLDGGNDGSADYLDGGTGSDSYIFGPGFGRDIVGSFDDGPGGDQDVIYFSTSIFANFAAVQAAMSQVTVGPNDYTVFISKGANVLELRHTNIGQLGADDFGFF